MKKGFTLVELSIVLIIIGLIIGGVMKGKDLINSAEHKKMYNTWVKEWQIVVNSYQDRTGALLGDGLANGGAAGTADGELDDIDLSTTTTVQDRLKAVGLDIPVGTNNGGSYSIKGKHVTGTATMTLNRSTNINKNVLLIKGMPNDVAMAFDKIADGSLDPQDGVFRIDDTTTTTWPEADHATITTVDVTLEI
jgi:prepilin-type N-terminal cleavage/methylation domain-containing protein